MLFRSEFFASIARLDEIDWTAVDATDWSGAKERKQAEFLVHGCLPWKLVSAIGVHSQPILEQTEQALSSTAHKPTVTIRRHWYY